MNSFQFPDGVKFDGHDDNGHVLFRVSLPDDEDNFIGRECPSEPCQQMFRVSSEAFEQLPELWCVYCGHHGEYDTFMTAQQVARMRRAVHDYAVQYAQEALSKGMRRGSRGSRKSGVSTRFKPTQYQPEPLPDIDEPRLILERTCSRCSTSYAIFNEHRFAPCCGRLGPGEVAQASLDAATMRLDVLLTLDREQGGKLQEQGVLHTTYADTLKTLVGTVEALARAVFSDEVDEAESIVKKEGRGVFQRLDGLAELFSEHLGTDVTTLSSWPELKRAWSVRHVFTHNDGIVDEGFLRNVPDSPLKLEQRVVLTEGDIREALGGTRDLCNAIAAAKGDN